MTRGWKGQFYVDRRIAGEERWVFGDPREARLRIPPSTMESVAFLAVTDGAAFHYGGTAFVVGIVAEDPTWIHTYLVTAAHCIREARKVESDLYLRLNTRDGDTEHLQIPNDAWVMPVDPYAVDIAVLPATIPRDLFALKTLRSSMFLDVGLMAQEGIGPGDDVFVVGLFSPHPGQLRNIPVARSGTLAAVAGEPIFDPKTGGRYVAHLVEVRSIGGLSGSPVFLRHVWRFSDGETPNYEMVSQARVYLLGLVRGHYYKPGDSMQSLTAEEQVMNSGIALVTPVDDLRDLLNREDLVAHRKNQLDEERKKAARQGMTLDTHFVESAERSEFDQFETLARNLVNTAKPPTDEKDDS